MSLSSEFAEHLVLTSCPGTDNPEAVKHLSGVGQTDKGAQESAYPEVFDLHRAVVESEYESVDLSKLPGRRAEKLRENGWTGFYFEAEKLSTNPRYVAKYADITGQSRQEAKTELETRCGILSAFNIVKPLLVIATTVPTETLSAEQREMLERESERRKERANLEIDHGSSEAPAIIAQVRREDDYLGRDDGSLSFGMTDMGHSFVDIYNSALRDFSEYTPLPDHDAVVSDNEQSAILAIHSDLHEAAKLLMPSSVLLERA